MEIEQLSEYLEEIVQRVNKLELQEQKENKRNQKLKKIWPDKKTCQQKKTAWHGLQKTILLRLSFVKVKAASLPLLGEEREKVWIIWNKFVEYLVKVEDRMCQLDVALIDFKEKEEKISRSWDKFWRYFNLVLSIVLTLFSLYAYAEYKRIKNL